MELIVVMVLVVFLFYYIYKMLAPGLRVWRQSDIKVSLQQNSLVAMYRLMNELKESNVFTVTLKEYDKDIDQIGTLICFASSQDTAGIFHTVKKTLNGKIIDTKAPEWQQYIIYYQDSKNRLRRHETGEYKAIQESGGMRIKSEPIYWINVNNLSTNTIVARNIEELKIIYNPDEANWKGGLNISIKARYNDPNPAERFETSLQTTFEVRYDEPEEE